MENTGETQDLVTDEHHLISYTHAGTGQRFLNFLIDNIFMNLTFTNALLRSIIRLVPFEPFSAFGTPWHDSWSKTMVIKSRWGNLSDSGY